MPDVLDEQHRKITERLKQLSPIVEEHRRLQAAAKALARIRRSAATTLPGRRHKPGRASAGAKATTATPTKKPGRPKKAGRPSAASNTAGVVSPNTKRRAGRRKGGGTRAKQALALVKEQPGITIPELATKMGIQQNYLYRVLPALRKERKVTKEGKGWYARGSKPSPRS